MKTPLFCQSCRTRTPHALTPTGAMKCQACGQWRNPPRLPARLPATSKHKEAPTP